MTERYIVRLGKYGAYIYDMERRRALTLIDTVDFLNEFLSKIRETVE